MSVFRVTGASMRESWLQSTQDMQSRLLRTQLQVSTGQRFTRPSEDPVAATRALQLDGALEQSRQYARNSELAKNRLSLEEATLNQLTNIMQRVRELAVSANNATQTNETRAAIANEIGQQLNATLEIANTQDGSGQYLFSGFQTRTQPFARQGTTVVYNGDQGQRELQIGANRRLADSDHGVDVFMTVRNGNGTFTTAAAGGNTGTGVLGSSSVVNPALYDGDTYTVTFTSPTAYEVRDSANTLVTSGSYVLGPNQTGQTISFAGIQFDVNGAPATNDQFTIAPSENQDMFTMLQNFITALNTPVNTEIARVQVNNDIGNFMKDIDQALGKVLEVRSGVGSRLAAIDTQENVNAEVDLSINSLLSELRDLDYAEALTRLQQQLTGLEASQRTYAMIQGRSLFDYF